MKHFDIKKIVWLLFLGCFFSPMITFATEDSEEGTFVTEDAPVIEDTELTQNKTRAKKELLSLVDNVNFTTLHQETYNQRIDNALTTDEINVALEEAKGLAELNREKSEAKIKLNTYLEQGGLTQIDFATFVSNVDNSDNTADIKNIVIKAEVLVKKKVSLSKLKNQVDGKTLLQDDYQYFEGLINQSDSVPEITSVIEVAEDLIASRISSQETLDSLVQEETITKEEADKIQGNIGQAKSGAEVKSNVTKATEIASSREKEEQPTGIITIGYVDNKGKEIKKSEGKTKEIGMQETFKAPYIEGYILVSDSKIETTYKNEKQDIVFKYEKESKKSKRPLPKTGEDSSLSWIISGLSLIVGTLGLLVVKWK